MGQKWVKNMFFRKWLWTTWDAQTSVFWPVFSPWGRVLAVPKPQNALKMGRFGTKHGSKMGQKRVFPEVILDHLGCSNKCFWPVFSPWGRILAVPKPQNALKMGRFGTKNG